MRAADQQPVLNLFDPAYAQGYLAERAPSFAAAHSLDGLTVTPIKRIIKRTVGEGFHHVVIRYDAPSFGEYPVFCTAYSRGAEAEGGEDTSREHAFFALAFLTSYGFKQTDLFLVKPLFFDRELQALFYQGIDGENLRSIIERPEAALAPLLAQTAQWIAELHQTPTEHAPAEIAENNLIATTEPTPEFFKPILKARAPKFLTDIERLFETLASEEKESLGRLENLHIIHGDLHPENVIFNAKTERISVTDFTDVALGDWAKDVGNFLQQLAFMSLGKRSAEQRAADQQAFLGAYRAASGRAFDAEAKKRIDLYRAWSGLRSAIYFLTKKPFEPAEAKTTLAMARRLADKELNL